MSICHQKRSDRNFCARWVLLWRLQNVYKHFANATINQYQAVCADRPSREGTGRDGRMTGTTNPLRSSSSGEQRRKIYLHSKLVNLCFWPRIVSLCSVSIIIFHSKKSTITTQDSLPTGSPLRLLRTQRARKRWGELSNPAPVTPHPSLHFLARCCSNQASGEPMGTRHSSLFYFPYCRTNIRQLFQSFSKAQRYLILCALTSVIAQLSRPSNLKNALLSSWITNKPIPSLVMFSYAASVFAAQLHFHLHLSWIALLHWPTYVYLETWDHGERKHHKPLAFYWAPSQH